MIKKEMVPEQYDNPSENGYLTFNETIQQKLYPDNLYNGETLNMEIAAHVIRKILGSTITITVSTDVGSHSRSYHVEELFKIKPSGSLNGDAQPLNRDLFISP